jgi:hypothetical protein
MVSLSGPLGITFTDATIATDPVAAPYIFVMSSDSTYGQPLSNTPLPDTSFLAIDTENASPGFRTVIPGDTFGLAHVSYSVSSSTPSGTDTITIAPPDSVLSDAAGNPISFDITNGSITVGSVIPEPSALTQATTAVLIGLGLAWRRRARQEM